MVIAKDKRRERAFQNYSAGCIGLASMRNSLRTLSLGETITSKTVRKPLLTDDAAMPIARHDGSIRYPAVFLASG